MKIESVDLFYLAIPDVRDIADGSQDALLVRVRAGGLTGWGECEASPLVSLANWVCPRSHAVCKPVRDSVLGQPLDSPGDIKRIHQLVRANGLDIPQTDHTLSGIDTALWDLMGRKLDQPVYELLGYRQAYPKTPYASMLFGADPAETFTKARAIRQRGYHAAKFGWGCYGRGSCALDADQVAAARAGLGDEGMLMIDAGTVWDADVQAARQRLPALQEQRVLWLEEPFVSGALDAYRQLAGAASPLKLAGGEGADNYYMAAQMIDRAGIGFVQIDTGRVGGITTAKKVADYAAAKQVTYVNHTFTTQLALCASLQPYAGLPDHALCEYPAEPSPLAAALTETTLARDADGRICLPATAGLGVEPNLQTIRQYLVDVEIVVAGKTLYRTPEV